MTRESGVVDVIAKGARKSASRLATVSEPLANSVLHLAKGRSRTFITQAQPKRGFPKLRSDLDRLMVALSLAEIYAAIARHGGQGEEEYEQLLGDLGMIEEHLAPGTAWITAVLRLLAMEGVMPSWHRCVVTGSPIEENPVILSPSAGGYVSRASGSSPADAISTKAEVALSLAKMPLEMPPESSLKLQRECMVILAIFARALAEAPLTATDQLLAL
ncbi:MAG: DNA repair protein RecO [Fimbriimonadaceae bacterium]|nr:DNA repair protein RecO [Fimbriimonadaceae bacterium]